MNNPAERINRTQWVLMLLSLIALIALITLPLPPLTRDKTSADPYTQWTLLLKIALSALFIYLYKRGVFEPTHVQLTLSPRLPIAPANTPTRTPTTPPSSPMPL